jgi:hypothetical protein
MDENKLEILRMIRDGKVTPEEGIQLLEAIETSTDSGTGDDYAFTCGCGESVTGTTKAEHKKKARFLIIQVKEGDKKKVNVKIPLKLAKMASRFIPKSAQEHMRAEGVELNLGELLAGLEEEGCCGEDLVNVDDDEGKNVRIFCC